MDTGTAGAGGSSVAQDQGISGSGVAAVVANGEATKKELLGADTKLELPSGAQEGALKEINDQIKAFDLNLKPEDIVIVKAREMFR